ncbi:hypothetical protein CA2015_2186 [Cyclobacterium amurskyense]|uniref:Uncharacterized protein n=1 Tax=Cyclobacterium amurskyense TaxID=320787 RepID=A0A0H4PTF6_9BACT|nr:hypothetical protein CA2015_2186 [Cyclobacterium amurskyense]
MKPKNQTIQAENLKKNFYEDFLNRLKKINNDLKEVKESLPEINGFNRDSKTETCK